MELIGLGMSLGMCLGMKGIPQDNPPVKRAGCGNRATANVDRWQISFTHTRVILGGLSRFPSASAVLGDLGMASQDKKYDRRHVLKILVIGGVATAVALPSRWTKPIVQAVVVPAHAAASAPPTTTTTTTTSTTISP